jgi:hypothetical protein
MIDEWWLNVVGHATRYEVSDRGRVRTKARYVLRGFSTFWQYPRVLVQVPGGRDKRYRRVMLMSPRRHAYVHHLVAAAFIGPCPEGCVVLHGLGHDNGLHNLRYGTPGENDMDRHVARVAPRLESAPF